MRHIYLFFIVMISFISIISQAQIQMEVEGDLQLFGRLNIISQGTNNVFVGQAAGVVTSTGGQNVFLGIRAGYLNTLGGSNTYLGYEAGRNNLSGNQNIAIGLFALSNNQLTSKNVAIGSRALMSLEDGHGLDPLAGNQDLGTTYNLAIGVNAGQFTNDATGSNGERNTFVGNNCATLNTTGYRNAFFGFQAGFNNLDGSYNTFIGHEAGGGNTSGTFNTLVGHQSTLTSNNFSNSGAFGSNASVNASNKIRIGDGFVTTVEGNGWSLPSDGRFKTNVHENVPGIDFVMELRPVSYQSDLVKYYEHIRPKSDRVSDSKIRDKLKAQQSKEPVIQTGFIAQEVEAAAIKHGFNFNGVIKPTNPQDNYGISYALLVVPVIKAMQEQQVLIESLQTENRNLQRANQNLENRLAKLEAIIKREDL